MSQGSGLPPGLMAAISAVDQGGGGAPAPAGPDPNADPNAAVGTGTGPVDNLQMLQNAIDQAQQYVDMEDDEVHKQTALQCIAKLQSILADEQKGSDNLLQGKADPRALRRAASGPAQ